MNVPKSPEELLGLLRSGALATWNRSTSEEPEPLLLQAERHVREGEERLARQQRLIERLERDKRFDLADSARPLLTLIVDTLALQRVHLEWVRREMSGSKPPADE